MISHPTISKFSFNDVYRELAHTLLFNPQFVSGTKDGEIIHELVNASFCIEEPWNCFATCRNLSIKYLEGELDFYLSGSPFLKDIACHSKFWNNVTDDNRTINSNYGKLLLCDRNQRNYTQFEYARDMLLRNPESKKAVMTIYSKENAFVSKDNPCTMFLQFMIRDESLHLFVKMRSSDIWFGLPYDVPFFVLVLYKMLEELKRKYTELTIGEYHHQSTSLHLYKRNFKDLEGTGFMMSREHDKDQMGMFYKIILRRIQCP